MHCGRSVTNAQRNDASVSSNGSGTVEGVGFSGTPHEGHAEATSGDGVSSSGSSMEDEEDAELIGYQEALHNLEQQRDAVSATHPVAMP